MKKQCLRCKRKRGYFELLFALDLDFCDRCLLILNKETRNKEYNDSDDKEPNKKV